MVAKCDQTKGETAESNLACIENWHRTRCLFDAETVQTIMLANSLRMLREGELM
jgi:hypothetical protein